MTTLYRNIRPARKVRLSFWGTIIIFLIACYGGLQLTTTFGLEPDGGGVLRPLGERLALGGSIALLGVVFVAGMYLYLSIYVSRIEKRGDALAIATLTPASAQDRVYYPAELSVRADHHKRLTELPVASSIQIALGFRTATIPIRVVGQRLPLFLDVRVGDIDGAALAELLPTHPE
ncbi:MAG: hypothetical protein ACR2OX_12430 [Methyloligellaceae bacterium]